MNEFQMSYENFDVYLTNFMVINRRKKILLLFPSPSLIFPDRYLLWEWTSGFSSFFPFLQFIVVD